MKKRCLSLILLLSLILTIIPSHLVFAQEQETAIERTEEYTTPFSEWAVNDLTIGDTYGIYPMSWYEKDMTKPINNSRFRVLIAGLRKKILKTDEILKSHEDYILPVKNKLTVKEVLETLHLVISNYDYNGDIGLKKKYSPVAFMEEYGIYTGENGEQDLNEICSLEQACVFATRLVTYIYDALDAGSKGFLWEINQEDTKVYLLGSLHLASYKIYPFSNTILEAFDESDALVLEVNLFDAEGAMEFQELCVYQDGTTLKDHVSEEVYEKAVAMGEIIGLPEEVITLLKPWYLSNQFSVLATGTGEAEDSNLAAMLGIDVNLATKAMSLEKPILEIEGYGKQGKVMDGFSSELQEYLLNDSIDSLYYTLTGQKPEGTREKTTEKQYLDLWLNQWREGDVEAFKESYLGNSEVEDDAYLDDEDMDEVTKVLMEEYYHALFTQRDKDMADYIDDLLQNGDGSTYFIVVGSGHYVSNHSVLDMLEEMDYEITQLK